MDKETQRKNNKCRNETNRMIRDGDLTRPDTCQICETKSERIVAHHYAGYDHPELVWFICERCNIRLSNTHDWRFKTPDEARDYIVERFCTNRVVSDEYLDDTKHLVSLSSQRVQENFEKHAMFFYKLCEMSRKAKELAETKGIHYLSAYRIIRLEIPCPLECKFKELSHDQSL